jgi:osmotically-inducible protein OsmY
VAAITDRNTIRREALAAVDMKAPEAWASRTGLLRAIPSPTGIGDSPVARVAIGTVRMNPVTGEIVGIGIMVAKDTNRKATMKGTSRVSIRLGGCLLSDLPNASAGHKAAPVRADRRVQRARCIEGSLARSEAGSISAVLSNTVGRPRELSQGRGPQGYKRSDERITEDINEDLTQHPDIDASNISVEVQNGEVTLKGTVPDRETKRRAEDIAESCSGVKDVQNQLRVKREGESESETRKEKGDDKQRSHRQQLAS